MTAGNGGTSDTGEEDERAGELMRVLVTGSRIRNDHDAVWQALDELANALPDGERLLVVHGACPRGADAHASAWVRARRGEEPHPADWRVGRSGGFRRDNQMVGLGADVVLTFIDPCTQPGCSRRRQHGSHGAVHCATAAAQAGIPVRHIQRSARERS